MTTPYGRESQSNPHHSYGLASHITPTGTSELRRQDQQHESLRSCCRHDNSCLPLRQPESRLEGHDLRQDRCIAHSQQNSYDQAEKPYEHARQNLYQHPNCVPRPENQLQHRHYYSPRSPYHSYRDPYTSCCDKPYHRGSSPRHLSYVPPLGSCHHGYGSQSSSPFALRFPRESAPCSEAGTRLPPYQPSSSSLLGRNASPALPQLTNNTPALPWHDRKRRADTEEAEDDECRAERGAKRACSYSPWS